jgi:hypothetical protein
MLSEMQRKYPKLFISGSPKEFLCEHGWYGLIDALCADIHGLLPEDDAAMFSLWVFRGSVTGDSGGT